ncbi:MAG: ABC transporter ATP-binding protein/permease [Gammaproteobacteria bacterium]|nr:ABC transporter ATP-binding protein/permease [Gammaproteobacteria bacterium]
MFKEIYRFFKFSGKENEKRFWTSVALEFVISMFSRLRFIAAYILIEGICYEMGLGQNAAIMKEGVTWNRFWLICILLLVSVVGMIVFKCISQMKQTVGGYTTACGKRMEIALKLRYLPMGFYNKNSLGNITSVTTNTMEVIGNIATRVVMVLLDGIVNTLVLLALMFVYNYKVGLVVTGILLVFIFINYLRQVVARKISKRKIDADQKLVSDVLEYTEGISEVKNYNMIKSANDSLNASVEENRKVSTKMELLIGPFEALSEIALQVGSVFLVLLSIILTFSGEFSIAVGIALILMSLVVFNEIKASGTYSSLLRAMSEAMDKAEDILNQKDMKDEGENINPQNKDIVLKDVSFSYDKKMVLDDVSLTIKEKTMVAIIGPSGSGKTTVCKLIARFFDVDKGEISLGGTNIKDYSVNSLMKNFSFVFQNVYLFNDTIKNNIKFGKDNATDEEVIEAAKKACCHDFIMSLPNGYDTVLDDGGGNISGGEKQRISIARAMLKDAPIIILDEATANIDPENESLLTDAFNNLTKDKTVIMIAHKLNTVKHADNIFVLDNGKIVESGKHDELIKNNGIYSRFIKEKEEIAGWKL